MNDKQPEALRLADALENDLVGYDGMSIPRTGQNIADEAAELRRLHAVEQQRDELLAENKLLKATQYGSGRLQELRDVRDKLHAENEDFRATIDYLTRKNAEQIGEIVALKGQRDELLEACKALTQIKNIDVAATGPLKAAVEKATDAISKSGGAA